MNDDKIRITIPGYRIERVIGKGGMATVYLAVQESLQRQVAVKVLENLETQKFTERFVNEGRCVAGLGHSNVVTIYDIGRAKGHLFFAMEYLPSGDLRGRIARGMSPDQALKLIGKLANCLHFVHRQQIVHRDIKPSNIMFRADGAPVLTDFGIAKIYQDGNDLTQTGTVMGSPHYLSPEQAQNGKELDGRADLYSLGVILYEMLTGRKPFTGDGFAPTLMAHIKGPIPRLPIQFESIQPIIDRLLAKSPEDRFRNGSEVVQAIRMLRASGGLSDTSSGLEKTVTLRMDITNPTPEEEDSGLPKESPSGKGGFRYAAVGMIVLMSLAGAWFFFKDYRSVAPAQTLAPKPRSVPAPTRPPELAGVAGQKPAEQKPEVSKSLPEPTPTVRERKIRDLLAQGRESVEALRLSLPPEKNARYYFNEVLKLEPKNAQALAGLVQVADRYAGLADKNMERGDLGRAARFIDQGLEVVPEHHRLLGLKKRVKQLRAEAAKEERAAPAVVEDLSEPMDNEVAIVTESDSEAPESGTKPAPNPFRAFINLFKSDNNQSAVNSDSAAQP